MTHKIVFLDCDTVAPYVTVRKPDFEHDWIEYGKTSADQVVERLTGAAIAVVNKVKITAEMLDQLPDLKMIAVAATGTDNFDLAACKKNGVTVSNIRNYAIHTVPELTFGLILALRRGIIGYREDVKNGEWKKSEQFCFFNHPINDLHGSKLGIIGEGSIGQSVATIAKVFGMQVMFAAHKGVQGLGPLYTPFDEVIETSDVIALHCPLMPATKGIVGMDEFRRMKRTALVINTARGGLIDDADLAQAITEGLIAGAGIDVVCSEPPENDNPMLKLLDRPNVIVTPHVAWASQEAMQILCDQLIDNIENFVAGSPSNIVG